MPISPWTTAFISLLSAVIGAVLGGCVTQIREWWKERSHRGRVATALFCEILAQADVATTCASLANLAEHGIAENEGMRASMLTSLLPPEPSAYRSLVGNLPLMSPMAVASTISLYGSLEWAKSVSLAPITGEAYPRDHAKRLGYAWRAVARNALFALEAMHAHSTAPTKPVDERHIAAIRTELQAVVRNEWPRVRVQPDGSLIIGPESAGER